MPDTHIPQQVPRLKNETEWILKPWLAHVRRYMIRESFVSTTKTSAFTVDGNSFLYPCDATGGAFAATLPPSTSSNVGQKLAFKRLNAGANAVTVTASGTDTIDGAATYALGSQYAFTTIVSDGAGHWYRIS